MTNGERGTESPPTLAEQIAAVEECLSIAQGVMSTALLPLAGRAGSAGLRQTYQRRIGRLQAAVATLKAAKQ